jgi:hypothetical protein
MNTWIKTCPNCGTENDTLNGTVIIECGVVSCQCTCVNCKQGFNGQQEYWQWLGLTERPPDERQDV